MTYYAALDLSLRTVNICVIDDQGEIRAETKLASEVEERSVTHAEPRPTVCD